MREIVIRLPGNRQFGKHIPADSLLRSAGFRRFWLSSILAQSGPQVTLLALPIIMGSDLKVATAHATVPVVWWMDMLTVHWPYAVGFVIGAGHVYGGQRRAGFPDFLVGRAGLVYWP